MGRKNNASSSDAPPPPAPEPVQPEASPTAATTSASPILRRFLSALCSEMIAILTSHDQQCASDLAVDHRWLIRSYKEALQAKIGTLSLEAQTKLEKDTAKAEAKADAKADAALKKKMSSQITIRRIERNKRKHITAVHGLEAFGIDLKKAAKQFASKFATGASVTKNAQGLDEVVVQGDVSDEIVDMIEQEAGVLKGIPVDNVEIVEEKKKKAGE
ncbi:Translation machinery-associated protein [Salix suchowensis]|nr:Translation machinery-associated protein [Salix suchowensis]